jgi:hypothetical protein
MTEEIISPRLIARKCGGWLALSGNGDPLQIGVTAPSETEAREQFWEASERLKGWISADHAARIDM